MKVRITATRHVEETKTVEIDLDPEAAAALDITDARWKLWAEQQATFSKGPWERVFKIAPRIDVKVEKLP